MPHMIPPTLLAALTLALVMPVPPAGVLASKGDDLVGRASAAALRAGEAWRGVVAHEHYVQSIRPWAGAAPRTAGHGPALGTRVLESDLLLVHDANGPWELHRDVIRVDDRPVTDREHRLQALFLEPSLTGRERMRQVTRESARFNLGAVTRTFNVPTFALAVVHPAHVSRFRFGTPRPIAINGAAGQALTFRERDRPTLVRSTDGRFVPLRGRLVLDAVSGELLHAMLDAESGGVTAHVEVWFAPVQGVPMRVPVRMWEWYRASGPLHDPAVQSGRPITNAYIDALATYAQFRRYAVHTEEHVRPRF